MLLNVRSLLPKIDQLQLVASMKSPHVICLTETWLNSSVDSALVSLPNYSLCRSDRPNRRGGGTAIYIHHDIHFVDFTHMYCDLIDVEISVIELVAAKILLICIYIPPNLSSEKHNNIHANLVHLTDDFLNEKPDHNHIVVGDFNNFKLKGLCDDLDLFSLIGKPTRKTNVLDHILISSSLRSEYNKDNVTYDAPLDNADHLMIMAVPNQCAALHNVKSYHTIFDLRKSHLVNLLHAASCIDWSHVV